MTRLVILCGALLALVCTASVQAQVMLDVAKITCRQIIFDKIISPKEKSLALWLSGYFNAKRNNTVIDVGAMEKNTDKVMDYCRMNQETTVMDAVQKALGDK
jgi:HdeA/HdeB family